MSLFLDRPKTKIYSVVGSLISEDGTHGWDGERECLGLPGFEDWGELVAMNRMDKDEDGVGSLIHVKSAMIELEPPLMEILLLHPGGRL